MNKFHKTLSKMVDEELKENHSDDLEGKAGVKYIEEASDRVFHKLYDLGLVSDDDEDVFEIINMCIIDSM